MIVVDAGVLVRVLVGEFSARQAAREALSPDGSWAAPDHMPLEVLRTFRRYELAGSLSAAATSAATRAFLSMNIALHRSEPWLLKEVWAIRHNVSIYDAPYVAIASAFAAPFVTVDERLARAAIARGVTVIVPGKT